MTTLPRSNGEPRVRPWGAALLAFSVLGVAAVSALGCASRGIPSYDPCTGAQACAEPRSTCVEIVFTTASASMCTLQRCVGDADCALDARNNPGACLGFDAALTTCFERCDRLADCADGWSCEDVAPTVGTSERVCVPAASS